MELPWGELGLSKFLALDSHGTLLFVDGESRPEARAEPGEELPCVSYTVEEDNARVIDLRLISRVLLPTLPEHTVKSLCAHYKIPHHTEREATGTLFAFLIAEALALDRDLISLLSQLLPAPSGELLAHMVPLVKRGNPPAHHEAVPKELHAGPGTSVEEVLSGEIIGKGLIAFEDRIGQKEMAKLVSRTFEEGGTLVVEAGSGTGKTFAYLIPALLYLRSHDTAHLVVSTRTKQLQEQLYTKDLPFLISCLSPNLKVALLKGRENYICLRRWQLVLGEITQGLERDLFPVLAPLVTWLFKTKTGDIEENSVFLADPQARALWPRLRDDPRHCLGTICPFFDDCFSIAARRRAKGANLVVVNHSLLLADLKADQGILGDYQYLVVDEAHALEGATRQAFTSTLTQRTLDGLLAEIEPPARRQMGGWIARLSRPRADKQIARVRELAGVLRVINARLFTGLADCLALKRRGPTPLVDDLYPEVERILRTLKELQSAIEKIGEAVDELEARREADGLIAEIEAVVALFAALFGPLEENTVHWYERMNEGVVLHSSPLEVATSLKEALYPKLKGLVLTSATLSLGGGFSYLRESLGLADAPREVTYTTVECPFSLNERMRLYLAEFLPPVDGPNEVYAKAIASLVSQVARETKRKVLVLFTSYLLLRAVHARIERDLHVVAQGIDGPRSKVIEQFRESDGGAILLGTDSFWEGVDLPGKDLEVLVITRLPFPVPTDPVLCALGERLAHEGRDPFLRLSVPLAILKLRQGAGRLIRTRNDRGVIIITDHRILHKSYGHLFTTSLPVTGRKMSSLRELLLDLHSWFD
jgi:ATP-dependent DNA helicase DinG